MNKISAKIHHPTPDSAWDGWKFCRFMLNIRNYAHPLLQNQSYF